MKILVTSLVLFAISGAISSSVAADTQCWEDPNTGYTCCPHPSGEIYCDPATGPN